MSFPLNFENSLKLCESVGKSNPTRLDQLSQKELKIIDAAMKNVSEGALVKTEKVSQKELITILVKLQPNSKVNKTITEKFKDFFVRDKIKSASVSEKVNNFILTGFTSSGAGPAPLLPGKKITNLIADIASELNKTKNDVKRETTKLDLLMEQRVNTTKTFKKNLLVNPSIKTEAQELMPSEFLTQEHKVQVLKLREELLQKKMSEQVQAKGDNPVDQLSKLEELRKKYASNFDPKKNEYSKEAHEFFNDLQIPVSKGKVNIQDAQAQIDGAIEQFQLKKMQRALENYRPTIGLPQGVRQIQIATDIKNGLINLGPKEALKILKENNRNEQTASIKEAFYKHNDPVLDPIIYALKNFRSEFSNLK